ncbi:MAG: TVP38/TMEM64 family protein [Chthoniobacterales bacterium]
MEEMWVNWISDGMLWIEQAGWVGWLWFIVLYTLTCVFFLPGSLLTVGAGAAYGFWGGTVLVSISSVAGAAVNFLTSRYLLRKWLTRKFANNSKFHALDHAVAKDGWQVILLSRISPVLPHSIVSYACGLTKISFTRFTIASWIGFIPISAAYAYAGAVVGKVARAKAGLHHGTDSWIFYGIGLFVTVAVTVLSTRMAAKAMRERLHLDSANGAVISEKLPPEPN